MAYQIAVCGPAHCGELERQAAHEIGQRLARCGAVVLCGGGDGVMAAAADGAREAGGTVVAIRPDGRSVEPRRADARYTAVVRTGMGQARNAILVTSADAVIIVGGSWGTLSELALAMRSGVPVVSIHGWRLSGRDAEPVIGPVEAQTPQDAVEQAIRLAG